jgi:hypothetical protein
VGTGDTLFSGKPESVDVALQPASRSANASAARAVIGLRIRASRSMGPMTQS